MNESDVRLNKAIHWIFVLFGVILVLIAIVLRSRSEIISDLLISVGATLIATSLLAYLYQYLGAKRLTEEVDQARRSLTVAGKSSELGITGIWQERHQIPVKLWNEFTRNTQRDIWLYGLSFC